MLHTRSLRVALSCALTVTALVLAGSPLHAAAPSVPTNLAATVNGQLVVLTWTASSNSPTQYIIRAGFAPGQTALTVAISGSQTSFTASAGSGTYYVRVAASNADGTSADSNNGFPVIVAGDEIAYFVGSGNAEGSSNVIALDILFASCGGRPELTYRDIAPEPAIWTGAGRFTGDIED